MKMVSIFLVMAVLLFTAGCDVNNEAVQTQPEEKIVLAVKRDTTGTIRNLADRFSEENSGISVKLMELSDESVENHRVFSSVLAGNEVTVDVMIVEDIWMKEFLSVGYLRPLDDGINVDNSEYPKRFSDIMYSNGRLYGLPFILDVGIMLYRTDLTDGDLNYNDFLKADSPDYSIQGVDKEEMICVIQECIRLSGGMERGLELYKSLIEKSQHTSGNYLSDFKSGKTAYARSWTSSYIHVQNNFSNIQGKVRTSLLRMGDTHYATARAYFAAVNSASDASKSEAINKFLNFLIREDVQLEFAKGTGTLPLKYKYYQNPLVADYNEYNEKFKDCLDKFNYRANAENYTLLSEAAQSAVSKYISGETDIKEAARAVSSTME